MLKRYARLGLAGLVGFLLYLAVQQKPLLHAAVRKAAGADEQCPWTNLARLPWDLDRFEQLKTKYLPTIAVTAEEGELVQFRTPSRPFWVRRSGSDLDGKALLTYVLAEQDWIAASPGAQTVRSGDVVVDVGAHVGTFGDDALRRGAAKVIMVEPDPLNVECIRRNFAAEIASGKVVVIPAGAWSEEGTLAFSTGVANSGTGSLVQRQSGAKTLDVRVARLDDLLREAGVDRVSFLKFDIEGAEREALKGAAQTMAKWRPRIMLDAYHLPDDSAVLPPLIRAANPQYVADCAVCGFAGHGAAGWAIVPYALFYR